MADFSVKQALSPTERTQVYAAFPTVAAADLEAVLRVLPTTGEMPAAGEESNPVVALFSADTEEVLLDGLLVRIPSRVYCAEPAAGAELALTSRQRVVLHCIYLRHHDGYVRQRRLEQLVAAPAESFTIPFTFSLLSDYVKEILEVIEDALLPALVAGYVSFIRENPRYWQRT
jgi:hypothetical protein